MAQQTINTISPNELLAYALRLKNANYRLVAIPVPMLKTV